MAKRRYIIRLNEVEVDKNDEYVKEYEKNLPHSEEISKLITDSWNSLDMKRFYDEQKRLASCIMTCKQNKEGNTEASITFETVPNTRFTTKMWFSIIDQTDAQLSDGWGEGFFDKIFTFSDGRKGYVD